MGDIAIAGETTPTMVHLPRNVGGLEMFLEDNSLAIIWNFVVSAFHSPSFVFVLG